jgi:hypothetical protein
MQSAKKALSNESIPRTKDGMPVNIEAVVRMPFKVPRREF